MWKRLCMRACPQLARTHADISTEVVVVPLPPAFSISAFLSTAFPALLQG